MNVTDSCSPSPPLYQGTNCSFQAGYKETIKPGTLNYPTKEIFAKTNGNSGKNFRYRGASQGSLGSTIWMLTLVVSVSAISMAISVLHLVLLLSCRFGWGNFRAKHSTLVLVRPPPPRLFPPLYPLLSFPSFSLPFSLPAPFPPPPTPYPKQGARLKGNIWLIYTWSL